MSSNPVPVVIGIFHSETEAKEAIEALRGAGFMRDQIGVAWHQDAIKTGYVNSLIDLGVAQEQAVYYDHEFRKGHPVISVRPDGREREAYNILHTYGAYDYDQRDSSTSHETSGTMEVRENNAGHYVPTGEQSMPIREERLRVHKQTVPTGEVRLYKDVVTEPQNIDVPVNREEMIVERHPGSGEVSDTAIGQDETIRIPLYKEQISINKVPVETGEVVIGKRIVQENQHITDTVRREEPRVDKEGNPIIHVDNNGENA
jgi:uncharacterized protein (TIGR02271 family)